MDVSRQDFTEFFQLNSIRKKALEQEIRLSAARRGKEYEGRGLSFNIEPSVRISTDAINQDTHGLSVRLQGMLFSDNYSSMNDALKIRYREDKPVLSGRVPWHCTIMLPALNDSLSHQHMLHLSPLSYRLTLPPGHPAVRAALDHETGHLKLHHSGISYNHWQHELAADRNKTDLFMADGRAEDVRTEHMLRAIDTFTSDITIPASGYWNLLAQMHRDPCLQLQQSNLATHLEVKHRMAAYMPDTDPLARVSADPAQQVYQCLYADSQVPLRRVFYNMHRREEHCYTAFHALERVVTDNAFTHAGSRELATTTLTAASMLFPDVMTDRVYRQGLAPRPRWLAP